MQKAIIFKGLKSGDLTKVTIETTDNMMMDYINAKAQAVFQLCEEVEEVEEIEE